MSSIDNSTRTSQQADLNDLQADYSRKKKEITKQNESQIADLKDYYQDKKASVSEENQAAINHIRKQQGEVTARAYEERQRLNETYNSKTQNLQQTYEEKLKDTREKRTQQVAEAQMGSHEKSEVDRRKFSSSRRTNPCEKL